jgi:hypothetical protein
VSTYYPTGVEIQALDLNEPFTDGATESHIDEETGLQVSISRIACPEGPTDPFSRSCTSPGILLASYFARLPDSDVCRFKQVFIPHRSPITRDQWEQLRERTEKRFAHK